MSGSLRPISVTDDTTPLQRLESQSSSSEEPPASPTFNGIFIGNGSLTNGNTNNCSAQSQSPMPMTMAMASTANTASMTATLSLPNHNNNKIGVQCLNNFATNDQNRGGANEKGKMNWHGSYRVFYRILVDICVLICIGLPIFAFNVWGEPYKRGFFCDDSSLMHPYRDSSVHGWMLNVMGFVVPTMLITLVEFFAANYKRMHGIGHTNGDRYFIWHLEIPDWIVECYKKIGVLIFGAGIGHLTTVIAKYSIGRLRPHFFQVCQPIMSNGTTCSSPINAGRYIEIFTCRGLNPGDKMLKEMRLSFPSGHATFVCFTMIYTAIYLETRMTWRHAKMFRHLLQFLFLMFAWYTTLTRVSDYKHHWTDVIAGSGIGTLYALVLSSSMW